MSLPALTPASPAAPRAITRFPAEPVAPAPALADTLAGARQAAEALEAMLPLTRAARQEADRASPASRREVAREFFTDLLDADEDGTVGRDEFVKVAEELFSRMDRDRDGTLGDEEMERDLEKGDGILAETLRRLFDGNGDGVMEAGEFRLGTFGRVKDARASRFLNLMDRTGDGRVTPREMRWLFGPMREDGGETSPFRLDRARLNLLA